MKKGDIEKMAATKYVAAWDILWDRHYHPGDEVPCDPKSPEIQQLMESGALLEIVDTAHLENPDGEHTSA